MATDRPALALKDGQRGRYTATVERYGRKRSFGHESVTILLRDVRNAEGAIVTDHLWLSCGTWSSTLGIGDMFAFYARVGTYEKGYAGRNEDVITERGYGAQTSHRLERPTRIQLLERNGKAIA